MISAKPTENLTGITIEGNFDDFYEITDSIYRMTGFEEDYDDLYWGVKNRLLAVCYDIRHAYMGDREVKLVDNGVHDEMMKMALHDTSEAGSPLCREVFVSGSGFRSFICPGTLSMVEILLWTKNPKAGRGCCISGIEILGLYQRQSGNRYAFGGDSWGTCRSDRR